MQKDKTQEELNLLGECFQKDIDINNISEQLLKEKQAKLILEEQVNAYKYILDKIENFSIQHLIFNDSLSVFSPSNHNP